MGWSLRFILVFFKCVLKAWGLIFDLFGHPVTTHFGMPRSMPAHSEYLSSLSSWSCRNVKMWDIAAKSSA